MAEPETKHVNKKKLEIAQLEDHGFEYDQRPFRNVLFTVVYLLVILVVIVGGAYSISTKKGNFEDLTKADFLKYYQSCPKQNLQDGFLDSQLLASDNSTAMKYSYDDTSAYAALERVSGYWLGATAVGAIIVGVLFLWLFSTCPWIMVILTVVLMFVVPAGGAAFVMLVQGKSMLLVGIPLIVAALVILVFLCCLFTAFPLVVKLLDKASDCVVEQPGMPFMVLVLIVALVIILIPMSAFVWAAGQVGEVVFNPASHIDVRDGLCYRLEAVEIPCCIFQMPQWAKAYYYFTIGTMVWTVFLVMQVKTFFVAGAAAQWYFNNEDPPEWNPTLFSLKHALTSSFGSLCVSSLLLTLFAAIRALVEKLRRQFAGGKANCLVNSIACCIQCFISLLNTITRFATMQMAITGQGFFSAAGSVVKLLTSNTLDAFGVWWIPDFILYSAAILASLTWGLLTYFAYFYYYFYNDKDGNANKDQKMRKDEALYLAFAGGFLCFIILSFFVFVLLNIVDALYITMAIDKDKGNKKRGDVHDVYHELPNVKRKLAEKEAEKEADPASESLI
eukprot:TRINITY_DN14907_c0_g1_i1.p1 TRINITY_DN14907_c0_g1~~TRINITY_DN14907_c0_g1_i1.p1  ORF type:complete len:596 (-),score=99.08 TRINITY_DN14907_c0_g1_i1:258-1937(-)